MKIRSRSASLFLCDQLPDHLNLSRVCVGRSVLRLRGSGSRVAIPEEGNDEVSPALWVNHLVKESLRAWESPVNVLAKCRFALC